MKVIFLSIFLILLSCSTRGRRDLPLESPIMIKQAKKNYLSVLSLNKKEQRKKTKIDVSLSKGISEFGPSPDKFYKEDSKKIERQPVVALVLGPGINRVLGHLALLKSLRKYKVPWHIISGEGLSSIIASYIAMGKTPEKIEWLFYKFFNETKGVVPFSKHWINKVENIFLKNLNKKKMEDLHLSTVIPIYNRSERKVHYKKNGLLQPALRSNLYLKNILDKRKFSTPFPWEVFNTRPYKSMGVDILIGIDVIGEKFVFDRGNEFLIGIFGKVSGRISIEKNNLDMYFQLPMSSMPLDSLKNAPSTLRDVEVEGEEVSKSILSYIKEWKKENTAFYK